MGRPGTHLTDLSAGWGPSGRWFKSSRPDQVEGSPAARPDECPDQPAGNGFGLPGRKAPAPNETSLPTRPACGAYFESP